MCVCVCVCVCVCLRADLNVKVAAVLESDGDGHLTAGATSGGRETVQYRAWVVQVVLHQVIWRVDRGQRVAG